MTTARQDLAAHLTATLPSTIKVIDTLSAVSTAKTPVVLCTRSGIERADLYRSRDDVLTAWLLSPLLDLEDAEVELDANLDVVLEAIETHPYLHWNDGRRDVYGSFHAFAITVKHRTLLDQ